MISFLFFAIFFFLAYLVLISFFFSINSPKNCVSIRTKKQKTRQLIRVQAKTKKWNNHWHLKIFLINILSPTIGFNNNYPSFSLPKNIHFIPNRYPKFQYCSIWFVILFSVFPRHICGRLPTTMLLMCSTVVESANPIPFIALFNCGYIYIFLNKRSLG